MQFLRNITKTHGALLFFDEVISGFRVGFTGAAGYYGIQPDIVTYGKIIGGGLPVGAYGASKAIMSKISPEGDVYQAGTLSGNPVAMAAGMAQLNACLAKGFYESLEKQCNRLVEGIRSHVAKKGYEVKLFSVGSIYWIAFTTKEKIQSAEDIDPQSMQQFRKLYHFLLEKGIYLGPSGYEVGFVSAAHSDEEIEQTIAAFNEGLDFVFGK